MNNNPTDKRNIIDYLLIFVYIFMMLISDNPVFRSYSLLGIAIVGILISIGILIFKKDITKNGRIRELIAIGLLVLAVGYAIYRIIMLK
jgi:chromate transport protein ChrA